MCIRDRVVTLQGWVYDRTSKGKLHFVLLRDGSGYVQCVMHRAEIGDALFDAIGALGQESSVSITGLVKADERAPGGFELVVSAGHVYQVTNDFPITPKEHGPDFLLSNRHLWLRSKRH